MKGIGLAFMLFEGMALNHMRKDSLPRGTAASSDDDIQQQCISRIMLHDWCSS